MQLLGGDTGTVTLRKVKGSWGGGGCELRQCPQAVFMVLLMSQCLIPYRITFGDRVRCQNAFPKKLKTCLG